jgi:hypothetical protein
MEGANMKAIKLVGLGVVVWGLSLIWPEVNQLLNLPVMLGGVLGLSAVAAAYLLLQRVEFGRYDDRNGQDHRSRPVSAAVSR